MNEDQEKKNQVAGALTSVGVHLVLIVLFLFVMGFTAPNPPLGELGSGVELQLGVDDSGSGDVQQLVPVTPTDAINNAVAETPRQEAAVEDQPKEEVKPVEDKPKEDVTMDDKESPVVVKEVKKEPKKVDPPKEKVVEKVTDHPVKEAPAEEKKDIKKETKESTSGQKDAAGNTRNSKGISQGNDKGKIGDKGSPEGIPDLKAQYSGKPGTGGPGEGGTGGISVSGFDGFDRPDIVKPEIPEDSYGTYEFLVKVNSQGDIEKITTKTRGIGLEAENIFKKLIQNLDFTPNKSSMPAFSEGTITFRVVPPKKK
jgi:protein TonB